jgi:hypothetical protein
MPETAVTPAMTKSAEDALLIGGKPAASRGPKGNQAHAHRNRQPEQTRRDDQHDIFRVFAVAADFGLGHVGCTQARSGGVVKRARLACWFIIASA